MKRNDLVNVKVEDVPIGENVERGQGFFASETVFTAVDKDGNEERLPLLKDINPDQVHQTIIYRETIYTLRQDDDGNVIVVRLTEEDRHLARKKNI